MSWSNAPYSGKSERDGRGDRQTPSARSISDVLGATPESHDLALDASERSFAASPATLVRRKSLPGLNPHHKPLARSRLGSTQTFARVAEDAERLLEDYLETGRAIQARRLTMSLARALEADLGHWEWSLPERVDPRPALHHHVEHLQTLCQPLLRCLITAGAWAEGDLSHCCTAPLEYLANPVLQDAFHPRKGLLPWLRHYQIALLTYGIGVAAVAGGRYALLSRLFQDVSLPEPFGTQRHPLARGLFAWTGIEHEIVGQLPEVPACGSLADHLHAVLDPSLRDLTGRPARYDDAFDRFETLLTCAHADQIMSSGEPLAWIPQERMTESALQVTMAHRLESEALAQGASWPPLRAGLFLGSPDRFLDVLRRVEVLRGNRLDDDAPRP